MVKAIHQKHICRWLRSSGSEKCKRERGKSSGNVGCHNGEGNNGKQRREDKMCDVGVHLEGVIEDHEHHFLDLPDWDQVG